MATVLTIASTRFNAGTTTSSSFVITAVGVSTIMVSFTISSTNLTNTANSFTAVLQVQQGASFVDVATISWAGDPSAANPTFTIPTDSIDGLGNLLTTLRGATCNLAITPNTRITMGVTVTTT